MAEGQDWFKDNAPTATAPPPTSGGDDWFKANAPDTTSSAPTTPPSQPGFLDRVQAHLDRAKARLNEMTEPAPGTPGASYSNLATDYGNIGTRALRSVGSLALGIPEGAITAYKGLVEGDQAAQDRIENFANEQGPGGVGAMTDQVKDYAKTAKTDPVRAFTDAAGDALAMYATSKMADTVAGTPGALKERVRGTMRRLGSADQGSVNAVVADQANKAALDEAKVHADNQAADETTLDARGKIDEANQKQTAADLAAQEKVRTKNADATARTLEKRGQVDASNATQLQKDTAARQQAMLDNKQALQEHQGDIADVNAENQAELGRHSERDRVQAELDASAEQFSGKRDAAAVRAKGINDSLWTKVRKKVSGLTTPTDGIKTAGYNAIADADPTTSAIFNRMTHAGEEPLHPLYTMDAGGDVIQPTDPEYADEYEKQFGQPPPMQEEANFDQLHRWYNWVQDKMYGRGEMPFGQYQAFKTARAALDQAMQSIAAKGSATADLRAARLSHQKMKEAFSDSPNQKQTVSSKVGQEVTTDYEKAQAKQDRLAKLAEYDPTLPSHAAHIDNLNEALSKLPKRKPIRDIVKPLPTPPELKDVPDINPPRPYDEPEPQAAIPAGSAPKTYGEPAPTKAFERPEVDTQQIREQNIKRDLQNRLKLTGYDYAILLSSAVSAPLHALGMAGEAFRTGAYGYVGGKMALRAVAENPKFVKWLSEPPANEWEILQKIPNIEKVKLADHITQAAVAAAKQGKDVKVAGKVAAWLGAANVSAINQAQTPPKNRKEALARSPRK